MKTNPLQEHSKQQKEHSNAKKRLDYRRKELHVFFVINIIYTT